MLFMLLCVAGPTQNYILHADGIYNLFVLKVTLSTNLPCHSVFVSRIRKRCQWIL